MGISNWVIGGSTRRTRRFSVAGRWLPAGAVMTGLVLLGGAGPASAQTLTWSVVPSPSRGTDSLLGGVSCVSATACTAAGDYVTSGGPGRTLIESWNGTKWSVTHSPSPGTRDMLNGVSCASAATCTAAGSNARNSQSPPETLIETGR